MLDDVARSLDGLREEDVLVLARRRGDGQMILLSRHLTAADAEEIIDLIKAALAPKSRRHEAAS